MAGFLNEPSEIAMIFFSAGHPRGRCPGSIVALRRAGGLPEGIGARPEWPQRTPGRRAFADLGGVAAGAINALGPDCLHRALRASKVVEDGKKN